jgi:hypothetical protein
MQPGDEQLWAVVLSPDPSVLASKRLQAFEALAAGDAIVTCTCPRGDAAEELLELAEHLSYGRDEDLASIVSDISGRDWPALVWRVWYPETYCAVRDAIDAELRSKLESHRPHGSRRVTNAPGDAASARHITDAP